MTLQAETKWIGKMGFDTYIGNHVVRMDTVVENNGDNTGPSPKKLLLGTLATCTGMDVVSLLEKMRVEFNSLTIDTKAIVHEEHPKVFTHVEIIYKVGTNKSNEEKILKAIHLSKDKYCGISAMLAKNSPIEFKLEII